MLNFRQEALSDGFFQQKHFPLSSMEKLSFFLSTVFKKAEIEFFNLVKLLLFFSPGFEGFY